MPSKSNFDATSLRVRAAVLFCVCAALLGSAVPAVRSLLSMQQEDARLLIRAERQRTLSQVIAKDVLAISHADSGSLVTSWRHDLIATYDDLSSEHSALQYGGTLSSVDSDQVRSDFERASRTFYHFSGAIDALLEATSRSPQAAENTPVADSSAESSSKQSIETLVSTIAEAEPPFVNAMGKLVSTYEVESKRRIRHQKWLCLGLFAGLFCLLPAGVMVICEQAIRSVRKLSQIIEWDEARLADSHVLRQHHAELAREIVGRQKAEDELRAAMRELERVSEVARRVRHPVLLLDSQGNVDWANPGFTNSTGYEAESILGRDAFAMLLDSSAETSQLVELQKTVQGDQQARFELPIQRADGTSYWALVELEPYPVTDFSSPVDETPESNGVGFVVTLYDITRRRERIVSLRNDLKKANEASEQKTQFLAHMSHEIRTPLSAVLGYTELIRTGELEGEEIESGLATIHNSGEMLLEFVNSVLDFSKLNANQEAVAKPCRIGQVIAQVIDSFRGVALGKEIALQTTAAETVPGVIAIDSLKLKRLMSNLVGNAVKFTDKGSVTIEMDVERDSDGPWIKLAVVDTGIGIPQDRLKAVFEPFQQAEETTSEKYGGTGLGLPICQVLVTQMGGTIKVSSTHGVGTRFDVRLPIEMVTAQEETNAQNDLQPSALEETAERVDVRLDDLRVLVCDDMRVNRDLIGRVLTGAGAKIDFAKNGREGVDLALKNGYDAILMDMKMPVLTGSDAVVELRLNADQTPVVALTADALIGERERCLALGCNDYLSKPVDITRLKQVIRRVVDERKKENKQDARVHDDEIRLARELFESELTDAIEQLGKATRSGDFAHAAILAHGLRGAALMVGIQEFDGLFRRIEAAAKTEDAAEIARAVGEVVDKTNGESSTTTHPPKHEVVS